jgi:hypothetical protein
MITPASSEADSDSEADSSSSASAELTSDSAATSESGDDQGGMGTVATAMAQLTMGSLTAMPIIREKDVSISARNYKPESFTQFLDNHERRPIAEIAPHPKSLIKAMELLSSVGAQVDIPIASLLEELGEEGVISHLLNNNATVR